MPAESSVILLPNVEVANLIPGGDGVSNKTKIITKITVLMPAIYINSITGARLQITPTLRAASRYVGP